MANRNCLPRIRILDPPWGHRRNILNPPIRANRLARFVDLGIPPRIGGGMPIFWNYGSIP